jgi:hydrogenase-4 component B
VTSPAAISLAGAGLLGLGVLLALPRRSAAAGLLVQAGGILLLGVAGVAVLATGDPVGASFRSAVEPAFGIDGLTGFFLAALALTAAPALVFARGYLGTAPAARAVGGLTGVFLGALTGVLCARDVVSFLGFWELMTLVPASAILVARRDEAVRRAVYVYLAITHLGGAGVWLALLALARYGAIGDPAALAAQGGAVPALVAVAALIGFGTKAGLMPLHSWLPRAHPVAPSHVSALMSGMMIKVALYGLVRVCFEWLGPAPLWLGLTLLALGALSALGGVLYALVQHDLKRLLAFHSIENVGIIVLALGAALVFQAEHEPGWAALAFAAGLLHTLNHAVFKSLLFLAAGSFERAVHGLELDRLGGLLRRMPWTGGAFLVGSMAIAGLPPLNGFASEWLALQSLLHLTATGSTGVAVAGALATAGLAATAALAVFCFVKVVGLVLLGRPRRPGVAGAVEGPRSMRSATAFLAAACVVLGLVPGLLVPTLAGLGPGRVVLAERAGLTVPGTGSLPPLGIALALAVLVAVLLAARGRRAAAPAPVWACGQRVEAALDWTSAGFTKPLRLVLEAVLRPERSVAVRSSGGLVQEVEYRASVPHLFDTAVYRPVLRASLAAAAIASRLQSGSLRGYVVYLLALVIALLALARTGALS